mmetsp:Transcript_19796/g.44953  ORF Transcript_19796/g.44953 Transcript_19796/m.44953 type:complete len:232 (-) Transcript_19796:118-813(-)
MAVDHGPTGRNHGVVIVQRFAHAHENHVSHLLARRPLEPHQLLQNLARVQRTPQSHGPRSTERTPHGAPDLARHARRVPTTGVPHHYRLDRMPVGGRQHQLGSVPRGRRGCRRQAEGETRERSSPPIFLATQEVAEESARQGGTAASRRGFRRRQIRDDVLPRGFVTADVEVSVEGFKVCLGHAEAGGKERAFEVGAVEDGVGGEATGRGGTRGRSVVRGQVGRRRIRWRW